MEAILNQFVLKQILTWRFSVLKYIRNKMEAEILQTQIL